MLRLVLEDFFLKGRKLVREKTTAKCQPQKKSTWTFGAKKEPPAPSRGGSHNQNTQSIYIYMPRIIARIFASSIPSAISLIWVFDFN